MKKIKTNVEAKNIGLEVEPPKEKCDDKHCPFHGKLPVKGRTFVGKVKSAAMHRSATVEWPRIIYVPKYERYMKKRSRLKVHNPDCINAKVGDEVVITECRPISKTKSFVIIKKSGK